MGPRGQYRSSRHLSGRAQRRRRDGKRRHGAIVNVASVAGMSSGPIHAYTAAKAGVIQITQTLAAEWRPRRRPRQRGVTGLHPHGGARSRPSHRRPEQDLFARPTAMNRLVEPMEVAQAIAWRFHR